MSKNGVKPAKKLSLFSCSCNTTLKHERDPQKEVGFLAVLYRNGIQLESPSADETSSLLSISVIVYFRFLVEAN
jgi:hypothetical protein